MSNISLFSLFVDLAFYSFVICGILLILLVVRDYIDKTYKEELNKKTEKSKK